MCRTGEKWVNIATAYYSAVKILTKYSSVRRDLTAGVLVDVLRYRATVNGFVAVCSGSMATFLSSRPGRLRVQRWMMGAVLAALGAHMAIDALKLSGIY